MCAVEVAAVVSGQVAANREAKPASGVHWRESMRARCSSDLIIPENLREKSRRRAKYGGKKQKTKEKSKG